MLARGEADAALVPVIEYQRLPEVAVVPGVCVGARRAVRSVVLVTRRESLREVRTVALDESSRTSAALVRVIFREFLGRDLEAATDLNVAYWGFPDREVVRRSLEFDVPEIEAVDLTAIRMPVEIDGKAIVLAMRDRSGVTIIGGQGELRGKIVRIGHIGYMDVFDVTTALAALELAMAEAGADIERAAAVTAALEAFNEPVSV